MKLFIKYRHVRNYLCVRTDGWMAAQTFGQYKIISRHFLWRGIKIGHDRPGIIEDNIMKQPRKTGGTFLFLFVLRFDGPVNPLGSCRARSAYLTTLFSWAGLVL